MFGTITPNQKSLSQDDKSRYQSIYCGLCHSLREHYNSVSRLCLTYDLTFLIMLLSSLYEPKEIESTCNCVFKKGKSLKIVQNEFSEYAADITVLLAYHKFLDDKNDGDHKIRGQVGLAALKNSYQKAKEKRPEIALAIEKAMIQISEMEADTNPNSDEISKVFGMLMAMIFCTKNDIWNETLGRFAANLGRFIYFMDAALDLNEDKKSGTYNPYLELDHNPKKLKEELSVLAGAATTEFEKLPLIQDEKILQNILYEGMWSSFNYRFSEKIKNKVNKKSGGKFREKLNRRKIAKFKNNTDNNTSSSNDKD